MRHGPLLWCVLVAVVCERSGSNRDGDAVGAGAQK
jgi:hypothetical protein